MAAKNLVLGRSLKSRVEERPPATWAALEGNIDESANLGQLVSIPGPLVVDIGDVDRINSVGVRTWMDFVKARETAAPLTIERCSPMMVGQITMITRFMGKSSRVASVLVPYFCKSCKKEHIEVLPTGPGVHVAPSMKCPNCPAQTELDDLAETYDEALRRITP